MYGWYVQLNCCLLSCRSADSENRQPNAEKTFNDLREVIRFLRREKEIVQCQFEVSRQENQRHIHQIEHLQSSIDKTKTMLDEERAQSDSNATTLANQNELMDKLNQLNVLRESNVTLREENEKNLRKASILDTKLKEISIAVEPLREENRNLQADLEVRIQEVAGLEEDNKRWKARSQQILSKYERIDPEEHRQLKQSTEELSKKLAQADAERQKVIADYEEKLKKAQAAMEIISQFKIKLENASKTAASHHSKVEELSKNITVLSEEKESLSKELQQVKEGETTRATDQAGIIKMKRQLQQLFVARNQMKLQYENEVKKTSLLSTTVDDLQTKFTIEFADAKTEIETRLIKAHQAREMQLTNQWKVQILVKDKELEASRKRLQAHEAALRVKTASISIPVALTTSTTSPSSIPSTPVAPILRTPALATSAGILTATTPMNITSTSSPKLAAPPSASAVLTSKRPREESDQSAEGSPTPIAIKGNEARIEVEPAAKRVKTEAVVPFLTPTPPSVSPVVDEGLLVSEINQAIVQEPEEGILVEGQVAELGTTEESGGPMDEEYVEEEEFVEVADGEEEEEGEVNEAGLEDVMDAEDADVLNIHGGEQLEVEDDDNLAVADQEDGQVLEVEVEDEAEGDEEVEPEVAEDEISGQEILESDDALMADGSVFYM